MSAQISNPPTKTIYGATNGTFMRFIWKESLTRKGAFLGEVTSGQYVDKPIQIYDAKSTPEGTDWGYQAQDGEFVCRMFVSADQSRITFSRSTKGNWPLITVFAIYGRGGEQGEQGAATAEN